MGFVDDKQAKELAKDLPKSDIFAVVADYQTQGRGTKGRSWMSGANNMFMTISLPMKRLPVTLTMIPLR